MFISFLDQLTSFVNLNVFQIQCFILKLYRLPMVTIILVCRMLYFVYTKNIQMSGHFLLFICIIMFSFVTIFTFMHFYPKHLTVHYTICLFSGFKSTTFCTVNAMIYHWATGKLISRIVLVCKSLHMCTVDPNVSSTSVGEWCCMVIDFSGYCCLWITIKNSGITQWVWLLYWPAGKLIKIVQIKNLSRFQR